MSNRSEDPDREGDPPGDACTVSRIEVEFAIPVHLPIPFMRALDDLLQTLVTRPYNLPKGWVHWVSGHGSKPLWSQADARFLGNTPDPRMPAEGEPSFDDSVYHIETSARPRHPGEK